MLAGNRKWILLVVLAILLGVGAAGFMFFRGSFTQSTITPSPTPFVEEPTPTPEQRVNKADLKVKVLNGSGVVGEAGKVQKILEEAGFTVESTGNADLYDHKTTDISAKETVPTAITDELKELLGADYTVETSLLSEDEDVDIAVTVGARKNAPTSQQPTSDKQQPTLTQQPTTSSQQTTVTPSITPSPTPTKIP